MCRCSGSGALVPWFAILPRTSSPPAIFPASSLAFPLTRVAGSFTTPPRAVSSPLRTSRLTSQFPFTPLPLPHCPSPPPATFPCSRSPSGRPPPPSGSCSLRCVSGRPTPRYLLVEVAIDSGAARGVASGSAEPVRAEPGGAEPAGAEPGGAEPEGAEPTGSCSLRCVSGRPTPRYLLVEVAIDSGAARGVASGSAEPVRAEPGGAEPAGAEPGGAEPEGAEPT
ncbi:unnamed protein product, partial [Closterium sp. NIES-54]